ncbi:YkuS family protein [Paenibacillus chitinolyticus]|uniref:YkuS family protein n=1 Tax=Paenibacillus chitinolyticus TaxID=79263 RepID=UPI003654585E
MSKIAVEDSLSSVKQALQSSGYEVTSLNQANGASCVVISGLDQNVMGFADATTSASVINAHGLTDEEIVQEVGRTTGQNQSF